MSHIIYTHDTPTALSDILSQIAPDHIFTLSDSNTSHLCLPLIADAKALEEAEHIRIEAGDTAKSLFTLSMVWEALCNGRATRRSALVCVGGGMVTDLGGFAAATFKRGIAHINIPTTLLSMVDAAVGGKTGINFEGFKNEIGAFADSRAVIIDTNFLRTQDAENIRSGYAEMLKHSLLNGEDMWRRHLRFPLATPDYDELSVLVRQSIEVKQAIVTEDPCEKGIRKVLNLGHTIGHALESHYMNVGHPVLHGKAVAWGLVAELYLAVKKCAFPQEKLRHTVTFIFEHYGKPDIQCSQYDSLVELMQHDKKNTDSRINFTLLSDVGKICLDQYATKEEIEEALDFLREG